MIEEKQRNSNESMADLANGRELQPEIFQNESGIGELGCN